MPGELTTEKMLSAWVSAEVNIKCAWELADAKNTSSPGTFYGHFESAWDSADVKKFFLPSNSFEDIQSAWDSVDQACII